MPILGTLGVLWYIVWVIVVRESPAKDKLISKDELRYIQESLGTTKKTHVEHPWKDIFRSKPVYAICASHFAENWGFYTLLTQLPTFLKGMVTINNRTRTRLISQYGWIQYCRHQHHRH